MAVFRKKNNGEYYLESGHPTTKRGLCVRNTWVVKQSYGSNSGMLYLKIRDLSVPSALIGKKVKIKLEIVEDVKPKIKKCDGCGLYFQTGTKENHCTTCIKKITDSLKKAKQPTGGNLNLAGSEVINSKEVQNGK